MNSHGNIPQDHDLSQFISFSSELRTNLQRIFNWNSYFYLALTSTFTSSLSFFHLLLKPKEFWLTWNKKNFPHRFFSAEFLHSISGRFFTSHPLLNLLQWNNLFVCRIVMLLSSFSLPPICFSYYLDGGEMRKRMEINVISFN